VYFRNLTIFRLPAIAIDANALNDALSKHRLRELGPIDVRLAGFLPPCSSEVNGDQLVYSTAGSPMLVCMGIAEKILPAAVINEALSKKVREIAQRDQRKVGAKERKRIKDEILTDLLPRAFTRQKTIRAYLDTSAGFLVVDTGSRKQAELVVTKLREALGSFPAIPLEPEESTRALFTHWMNTGEHPGDIQFGDECELREPSEAGGKWVGRKVDLQSDEVREHLRSGMQAVNIGLVLDECMGFTLSEDLTVRKLKLLVESEVDGQTNADVFASEFAVLTLQTRNLLEAMDRTFRFTPAAQPLPAQKLAA